MNSQSDRPVSPGQWLRRTRERHGFRTLGDFARALEVDQSQVSRYELDRSVVPDDKAERISEVLGIDIVDVRRNLGLWVPPEVASTTPPETDEEPTTAELIARAESLMVQAHEYLRRARGETA